MSSINKAKKVLTLLPIVVISGCSLSSGKSDPQYLGDAPVNKKFETIRDNLIRRDGILASAGVISYPLTGTLVKAKFSEEARKQGTSSREVANDYSDWTRKSQSCFYVEIFGKEMDAANLKYWGIQAQQGEKVVPLHFIHPAQYSVRDTVTRTSGTYNAEFNTVSVNSYDDITYSNSDIACTAKGVKVDFLSPFALALKLRFLERPRTLSLRWD